MSKNNVPSEAEVALAKIRAAADAGKIEFASDTLTSQLDAEIQEIFRELFIAHNGRQPKRPIWAADGSKVGVVLDYDPAAREYSQASLVSCRTVGEKLSIDLTPETTWEDAGLQLRAKRATLRS